MWPGSGYEDWFLVEGAVFEHAVDHVAASAGEADCICLMVCVPVYRGFVGRVTGEKSAM